MRIIIKPRKTRKEGELLRSSIRWIIQHHPEVFRRLAEVKR